MSEVSTIDQPVTFSSFPQKAHEDFAKKSIHATITDIILTQIYATDPQYTEITRLFGSYNCTPAFATFSRPISLPASVFGENISSIDPDIAYDLLQDALDKSATIDEFIQILSDLGMINKSVFANIRRLAKG